MQVHIYIFCSIQVFAHLVFSDEFLNFNTKELFHVKLIEFSLNGSEIHEFSDFRES